MQFTGQVRAQTEKTPIYKVVNVFLECLLKTLSLATGFQCQFKELSLKPVQHKFAFISARIPFNHCARDSAIRSNETMYIEEAFN